LSEIIEKTVISKYYDDLIGDLIGDLLVISISQKPLI